MDLELDFRAISDAALQRVGATCHGARIPRAVDALVVRDSIAGVATGAGSLVVGMKLLEAHEGELARSMIQVWFYRLMWENFFLFGRKGFEIAINGGF